jgi:hypothetical protein
MHLLGRFPLADMQFRIGIYAAATGIYSDCDKSARLVFRAGELKQVLMSGERMSLKLASVWLARFGVASVALCVCLLASCVALAQECSQASEIDPINRAAIDNAARQFIEFASHGDVQSMRQGAIPALASGFDAIQQTVTRDKGSLGDQVTIRRDYLLDASRMTERSPNTQFFCGVYGTNGHTPTSASFAIPNLDPGQYALVLTNVTGGKLPHMVTVVLQKLQGQWKLAGYYPKITEVSGHDAEWYAHEAKQFRVKGQLHNAYFYYMLAWEIYAPVDFMSSLQLDKLANTIQEARPSDVPAGQPVPLAVNGRTYNLTQIFAVPDERGGLSLVVRYEAADVGNTIQASQDNLAMIRAIATKFPEVRTAFSGIVARATTASGQDYGTLQVMKEIP